MIRIFCAVSLLLISFLHAGEGPAAHWSFNELSGVSVPDVSGNGSTGQITGNPQIVPGIDGNALTMDGDDHVAVPVSEILRLADFTWSAWINIKTSLVMPVIEYAGMNITPRRIGAHMWVNTSGWARSSTGGVQFNVENDQAPYERTLATSGGQIVPGEWQHLAVTFDSKTGHSKIYVNGQLEAAESVGAGMPITHADTLFLGWRPFWVNVGLPNYHFNGSLDEVEIYSRVMDQEEIAGLYNALKLASMPGCDKGPRIRTRHKGRVRVKLQDLSENLEAEVFIREPDDRFILDRGKLGDEEILDEVLDEGAELIFGVRMHGQHGECERFSNSMYSQVESTGDTLWNIRLEDEPASQADWNYDGAVMQVELLPEGALGVLSGRSGDAGILVTRAADGIRFFAGSADIGSAAVYDIGGRRVKTLSFNRSVCFWDVSTIASGVYRLKVNLDGRPHILPVIVD